MVWSSLLLLSQAAAKAPSLDRPHVKVKFQRHTSLKHFTFSAIMSAPRDSPMAGTINDADVMLNRINVALARSQRLISSWAPPKPVEEQDAGPQDEDEEYFKPMTETAGLGSNVSFDDEEVLAGTLHRKKLSASNEKLLEQLIGKKAAQARNKSQEAGKSITSGKHAAPKPLIDRSKPQQKDTGSESEEEGGRAAVFKSRKRRKMDNLQPLTGASNGEQSQDHIEEDGAEEAVAPSSAKGKRAISASESDLEEKPVKRKTTSYLDEVLAQKAKKTKKKKAKHKQEAVS